jgi:hypothetical protein
MLFYYLEISLKSSILLTIFDCPLSENLNYYDEKNEYLSSVLQINNLLFALR